MTAYYNEIDPYAAQWLRNLIEAGHIAPGIVDQRSIEDVRPSDLAGFRQCHFFAGVGVWSLALRRAGWPDDRPVWTGSCPCQPFSAAGAGAGFDDERHLWPAFFHLIEQCRPASVFGEQVASKDADTWIDLVQDDLEGLGYAVGAVPFPSAGVGAPHIRDRLYWLADADHAGLEGRRGMRQRAAERLAGACGVARGLAHPSFLEYERRAGGARAESGWAGSRPGPARLGDAGGLGYAHGEHTGRDAGAGGGAEVGDELRRGADGAGASGAAARGLADTNALRLRTTAGGALHDAEHHAEPRGLLPQGQPPTGPTNGLWRDADWLLCRDGRWRPVEPGTFPLAHGAPARVGRLRAYGNAINAEAARVFVEAVMEVA